MSTYEDPMPDLDPPGGLTTIARVVSVGMCATLACVIALVSCSQRSEPIIDTPPVHHPDLHAPEPIPDFITRPDATVPADTRATWLTDYLTATAARDERLHALNEQIKERDKLLEEERRKTLDAEGKVKIAADDAAAVRDREGKIVDACRFIGMGLIPGGFALFVASFIFPAWGLPRKIAMVIVGCGFASLMMGRILSGPLAEWLSAGAGVTGLIYGVGTVGMNLWTQWQTNQQAAAKRRMANATRDGAEAAVLIAEANVLEHVGASNYKAKSVMPGPQAVAMVQEACA